MHFLAITTNIPQRLKTGFVLQGHIYASKTAYRIKETCIRHKRHIRIDWIITACSNDTVWGQVLPCSSLICKVTQQWWRWEEFLTMPTLWWWHCLTPQVAPDNLYLENTDWGKSEETREKSRERKRGTMFSATIFASLHLFCWRVAVSVE